jgi:hypothetical protein
VRGHRLQPRPEVIGVPVDDGALGQVGEVAGHLRQLPVEHQRDADELVLPEVEPVETQPIDSGVHSGFTCAQAGVCRKLADRRDLRKETCSSVLTVRTRKG